MNGQRAVGIAVCAVLGFAVFAAGGFLVASAFDEALFGWHETIGPEIGFAPASGLAGAVLAATLVAARRPRTEDRR